MHKILSLINQSLHKLHNLAQNFQKIWTLQLILVKFNAKGPCIMFVYIFRTIAQILQKLELPQTFFKKFKIP